MRYWISHIRNLESFAADPETHLEAWADGGVDGLVVGPMQLNVTEGLAHSRRGETLPHSGPTHSAFVSDPAIYRDLGVDVPLPPPAEQQAQRDRIQAALQAVVDRGWELWVFNPLIGAVTPGPDENADWLLDERSRASQAARMLDTVAAYPMATGIIIDGPAWGFELLELPVKHMARNRIVFDELPERIRGAAEHLGYDFEAMTGAKDRLWESLHTLDAGQIAAHSGDSPAEALTWLGGPAMDHWMQFRVDALTSFYEFLTDALHRRSGRELKFAVCPRQPAVARMAGYDYGRISHLVDVIMPKFYYWQRGYDGLLGTAHRWARALTSWNPGLDVRSASQVARLIFGEAMPVVDQMIDFDRLVTPDYVGWLTERDAQHSLTTIGERARIVPWVDTGRAPHDGDPLSARHLEAIISAVDAAGIGRLNFFNSTNLTEADWTMLSHHGGREWNPDTSPYLPADRPTR